MRGLVYKELREQATWAVAAGVVLCAGAHHHALWCCSREALRHGLRPVTLWSDTLALAVWLWPVAVAARQTLGESLGSTWTWLRSRPQRAAGIVAVKALVGIAAACLPVLASVGLLSFELSRPGALPRPLDSAELAIAVRACAAAPVVYLGTFLALLPPGQSWSARLVGCAGALLLGGALVVIDLSLPACLAAALVLGGGLACGVLAAGGDRRVG